jgi:hypothetical protein
MTGYEVDYEESEGGQSASSMIMRLLTDLHLSRRQATGLCHGRGYHGQQHPQLQCHPQYQYYSCLRQCRFI